MKTTINIQIRLMAIAIFSVLITGMSSLYLLDSVRRAEDEASLEQHQLLKATLELEEAHTQFKLQVQEWKNLLLRGRDANAYQHYLASFNQQTDEVRRHFAAAEPMIEGPERQQLDMLVAKHKQLVDEYLHALAKFKLDNTTDVEAVDKALRGIDRPLDNLFPELAKHLSQKLEAKLREANNLHDHDHKKHVWWISICVAINAVLIAISFGIGIKAQASHKSVL